VFYLYAFNYIEDEDIEQYKNKLSQSIDEDVIKAVEIDVAMTLNNRLRNLELARYQLRSWSLFFVGGRKYCL